MVTISGETGRFNIISEARKDSFDRKGNGHSGSAGAADFIAHNEDRNHSGLGLSLRLNIHDSLNLILHQELDMSPSSTSVEQSLDTDEELTPEEKGFGDALKNISSDQDVFLSIMMPIFKENPTVDDLGELKQMQKVISALDPDNFDALTKELFENHFKLAPPEVVDKALAQYDEFVSTGSINSPDPWRDPTQTASKETNDIIEIFERLSKNGSVSGEETLTSTLRAFLPVNEYSDSDLENLVEKIQQGDLQTLYQELPVIFDKFQQASPDQQKIATDIYVAHDADLIQIENDRVAENEAEAAAEEANLLRLEGLLKTMPPIVLENFHDLVVGNAFFAFDVNDKQDVSFLNAFLQEPFISGSELQSFINKNSGYSELMTIWEFNNS